MSVRNRSRNTNAKGAFVKSIQSGDLERVRTFIDKHPSAPNSVISSDMTPLMHACHQSLEIVKLLLERGADVEATTVDNSTVFLYACNMHDYDNASILKELVNHIPPKIIGLSKHQLQITTASNRMINDITASLRSIRPSNVKRILDTVRTDGHTALSMACRYGHIKCIKVLLSHGVNVNPINTGVVEVTPIINACYVNRNIKIIELLLEKGANINAPNIYGKTPLIIACENNDIPLYRFLIRNEASILIADNAGTTSLIMACEKDYIEIVKMLLKHKDINITIESQNSYGQTAIMRACRNGHINIVRLLLNKGASIESKDINNLTPIDFAKEVGHADIVDLLVKYGNKSNSSKSSKSSRSIVHLPFE